MSLIAAGKGFFHFSYRCKDNKMNAKVTRPVPFYAFSQCLRGNFTQDLHYLAVETRLNALAAS